MSSKLPAILLTLVALSAAGWLGLRLWDALAQPPDDDGDRAATPVEVADVERGSIELVRVFNGTLEPAASFRVAPKVGGRIERLVVDLADTVTNGQVVAELDDAEFEQEVTQAEADLAVAEANLAEALSAREIAARALQRQSTLLERGVASDVQFDTAQAESLATEARVAVAEAGVQRATSVLKAARIRRSYTQVRATWNPEAGRRVVAARSVDEGDTVAANTPLLTIVQLDPLRAVLYVAERDYPKLSPGQTVRIETDSYGGRRFEGRVERVAPVFEAASRQARVELSVPNPDGLLKPGMFIRAEAVLERVEDAVVVPTAAVTSRDDRAAVFLLDEAGSGVQLVPVEVGIQGRGRTQVLSPGLEGRVVTLGQQLLDDGSRVAVSTAENGASESAGGDAP